MAYSMLSFHEVSSPHINTLSGLRPRTKKCQLFKITTLGLFCLDPPLIAFLVQNTSSGLWPRTKNCRLFKKTTLGLLYLDPPFTTFLIQNGFFIQNTNPMVRLTWMSLLLWNNHLVSLIPSILFMFVSLTSLFMALNMRHKLGFTGSTRSFY